MYAELTKFDDYRALLQNEWDCRRQRNPSYSLRAFARDLKTSPSTLSSIFSGQQGLSRRKASSVANALQLTELEHDFFCDLVDSTDAKSKEQREMARIRLRKQRHIGTFVKMRLDVYKFIADWYHVAILEMTLLESFDSDPYWIAEKLGITGREVKAALTRMERLGVLKRERGRIIPTYGNFMTEASVPGTAIAAMHEQILGKAMEALRGQSLDLREFSSAIVAINDADIPLAKKRMASFVQDLSLELSKSPGKNQLYVLSNQFFSLSPGEV